MPKGGNHVPVEFSCKWVFPIVVIDYLFRSNRCSLCIICDKFVLLRYNFGNDRICVERVKSVWWNDRYENEGPLVHSSVSQSFLFHVLFGNVIREVNITEYFSEHREINIPLWLKMEVPEYLINQNTNVNILQNKMLSMHYIRSENFISVIAMTTKKTFHPIYILFICFINKIMKL